ncbi:MAG TPA: polysaccharide deacetylase family protein [Solirubrobacterales bacterium]|nr:polysaccharide deacetylase family protein [Solirubrobacterales bacterium]
MVGNYGEDEGAERARRRAVERRRLRRQRLLAAGALVLVIAATAAAVVALRGGHTVATASHPRPEAAPEAQRATRSHAGWRPYTGPVPILEYHVLGRPQTEVPYPDLYMPRASFTKQMDWLQEQEYEAVTLEEVEDAWFRGGELPPRPVVISFDDGYRPQYTFALPELRKRGWPGVINLKAEGSDLYESNVRAMLAAGWELASHTIDHSDLTTLDPESLQREVSESRRILRHEYDVPVANFCYPAGRFDSEVIAAVEAAGYIGATTEIPGFATRDHPYELARIEVLGSWTLGDLAASLQR